MLPACHAPAGGRETVRPRNEGSLSQFGKPRETAGLQSYGN